MLIETRCGKCGHEFSVNAAYVGTTRKCPECDHRFVLDESVVEDVGEQLDGARGRKVACPECLRSFVPPRSRQNQDTVECQTCLQRIDVAAGERLHEVVRRADRAILKGLLLGKSNEEIARRLSSEAGSLPNGRESLDDLIWRQVEELPYERFKVLSFGSSATQKVVESETCDKCHDVAPESTLHIVWQLTQHTSKSVGLFGAGLSGFLRGAFLGTGFPQIGPALSQKSNLHHSSRQGIHFFCGDCTRSVGWWKRFFRLTLDTNGEYLAQSVRRCKLVQTDSGTELSY